MPLFIKHLSAALMIIIALISSQTSASYIDSETDGSIVYSLFSAPNNIQRYDMAAEASLGSISLNKTPTAFAIANGIAYVAFNRELRAINLASGSNQFIKNTSTDIIEITALGTNMLVAEENEISILSTVNFQLLDSKKLTTPGRSYIFASNQSAIYFRDNNYTSTIHKMPLGSNGQLAAETIAPQATQFNGTKKLFLNKSQTKIYDNIGAIYFTDALTTGRNIESTDTLTFVGDNPIALQSDRLRIYTSESIIKGEIILPSKPIFIASHQQKVFSFALEGGNLSSFISDLSSFKLAPFGQPANPVDLTYTPEFYEQDGEGNIYLIDRESLSVFRWSTTKNTYLETWPLTAPPTSATYSPAHKRLYLGYASGKITWLSPSETAAQEHELTTLMRRVNYLLSAGDYLFATDGPALSPFLITTSMSEYSLDSQGVIIDSSSVYPRSQYLWNSTTNRIYRYSEGSFNNIDWTELNPSTGRFGEKNDPIYYNNYAESNYPLIASDDGQYILNGAGQLLDALSRNLVNSLSNRLVDGVWINNKPITISRAATDPYPYLSFWSKDLELLSSYALPKASDARVLNVNNKLLLIQQLDGKPTLSLLDQEQLPDTDGDKINDLLDNCINAANADQADLDKDSQGDACDSDDDNDSIPDITELSFNLDPLNPNDAKEDADKDGFSNIMENLLGSSMNEVKSTPLALSNYHESFENGWPAGFYGSPDTRPWSVQAEGNTGSHVLQASFTLGQNYSSEINFSAFFNAGLFTVKYKFKTLTAYNTYSLSLIVDGASVDYRSGYVADDAWQVMSARLTPGIHTISLNLGNSSAYENQSSQIVIDEVNFQSNPDDDDTDNDSLGSNYDNCPDTANLNQLDVDGDSLGDACDPTDDRPKDSDLDGIYDIHDNCPANANTDQADIDSDYSGDACDPKDDRPKDTDGDGLFDHHDNCPNIKNLAQNNIDGDPMGDACDDDIDGDGISNTVEQQYSFMNESYSDDADKDQDGDGVSNGYEIAHSAQPDVANTYPSIPLYDFYPLGEINFTLTSGYDSENTFIVSMKKSTTANVYNTTESDSAWTSQIERKDSGIYALKEGVATTNRRYSNHLILPASMKLGGAITNKSTATIREDGTSYIENIVTRFELIATGQTVWQGKSYASITLRQTVAKEEENHQFSYGYTEDIVYLKGIGPVSTESFTLEKIEIIKLDKPAQSEAGTKTKSGGGAVDIWFYLILALLPLMGGRKSYSNMAQSLRRLIKR